MNGSAFKISLRRFVVHGYFVRYHRTEPPGMWPEDDCGEALHCALEQRVVKPRIAVEKQ
jgi:hypothetical protein